MEEPTTEFDRQVQRLHELNVWGRWLCVGVCWLVVFPPALWALRGEFALWRSHFTWTAVRYAIRFNLFWSLALGVCVGLTLGTLMWQSSNILYGFTAAYRRQLERRVARIRTTGRRHPFWRWTIEGDRRRP